MKIKKILLNQSNSMNLGDVALGDKVRQSGYSCLWEERRENKIDVVVIHYISAIEVDRNHPYKLETILNIFCEYGVSSHYLISRRGLVVALVPEEGKAWHCGGSIMPEPDNRIGVNEFSIGIELMATQTSGFTSSQYDSLTELCIGIERRHGKYITYVGHDTIAGKRAVDLGLRKSLKTDPGLKFDWDKFYKILYKKRETYTV